MFYGQELINDNGISAIALAFFTALFAAVSSIGVAIVNNRKKTEELKDVTVKVGKSAKHAAESAEKAKENTENVSNGFVGRMDRKLDQLIQTTDEVQTALTKHLEWHLDKETPK